MKVRVYRDRIVWQRGMELATAVYRATRCMPREEMYGLTSQMRRAATSIPMNIAEGYGKHTRREHLKGLRIAMGSLCELRTAYEISTMLQLIAPENCVLELLAEVDRLLWAVIRGLEAKEVTDNSGKTQYTAPHSLPLCPSAPLPLLPRSASACASSKASASPKRERSRLP